MFQSVNYSKLLLHTLHQIQATLQITYLLGLVHTECQRQCSINAAMTLVTQHSLKRMELLQNELQPHSQATQLILMKAVSLALMLH